jgi:2'-5' RNA ligase
MIRAFVAIRPPDEMIDRLVGLQAGAPGRVSPPENLHLTLAFLGEIPTRLLEDADTALGQIKAPGFALTLDGVGLFGGSKPRLIYADVRSEPALTALQAKVAQTVRDAGIELESRRYSPHITLARLDKRGADRKRAERFAADRAAFLAGPFEVAEFNLYRSTLHTHGPVYDRLKAYALT